MSSAGPDRVRVWDPAVRLLHWSLVVTVVASWLTRHSPGSVHEWWGYGALAVVVLRVAWGFGRSRYARFGQFVRPPAATGGYLASLLRREAPRYLGHNPLGGWMAVALLATVAITCLSGWLYTTDWFWGVAWVEAVHVQSTNLLIALVVIHLLGALVMSFKGRENLVGAMLHGRKRAAAPGDIDD